MCYFNFYSFGYCYKRFRAVLKFNYFLVTSDLLQLSSGHSANPFSSGLNGADPFADDDLFDPFASKNNFFDSGKEINQNLPVCFSTLTYIYSVPITLKFITNYTIDIANPSSVQDTYHMSFVIDLALCRVSVAQC